MDKKFIEDYLAQLLPQQKAKHKLFAAMNYSVLNNGKRLRPALVYATGEALNAEPECLHAAAAAIELVHCYSLVHDDLPAMDDDDLRRGQPTCHIAFDEATAILTGDALQSLAFQVLADPLLNPCNAERRIAMVNVLAAAIGPSGMVLGQAQDMAAQNKQLSLEELIILHSNKTGKLFSACVELAYIASPVYGDTKIRSTLLEYANKLGLAFQIQDDILDITGDEHTLGKPPGSDLALHKSTFPSLLGLAPAQQYASDTILAARQALEPLGPAAVKLGKLLDAIQARKN